MTVDVDAVVELPGALPLRWDADDETIPLRLVAKTRESDDVASFVFEAADGMPLPEFVAGQYLPLALEIPGVADPVRRTWTLSGPPSDARWRITVKREPHGLASRHLHDRLEPGAVVAASRPAGEFVLAPDDAPVVLLSAGVGVTPMVSMLHALAAEAGTRAVWFVHGARDGRHHPLAREVRDAAARRDGVRVHVVYSRPAPGDDGHDGVGHVDGTLLTRLGVPVDAQHYVCGPDGFIASVLPDLRTRGVPGDRVHTESFGARR